MEIILCVLVVGVLLTIAYFAFLYVLMKERRQSDAQLNIACTRFEGALDKLAGEFGEIIKQVTKVDDEPEFPGGQHE